MTAPLLEGPVVVAAHDAGAANHLIAWLAAHPGLEVRACMRGPALGQWQQAFPGSDAGAEPAVALAGAATLLSGTGWASHFEHQARRAARARGVQTVALIDHWTNYRARFERDGELVLPDEIWVTDADALALARATFPGLNVVLVANHYQAGLLAQVAACDQAPDQADHVLYVLEPIRDAWGGGAVASEFRALDFFLRHLDLLGLGEQVQIRLRPHPSDPPGKYDAWIAAAAAQSVRIGLDQPRPLAESLAWSGTVVGCQTYAMVLALAAGKRVFSSVPAGVPACVLPQATIRKMADLVGGDGGAPVGRTR